MCVNVFLLRLQNEVAVLKKDKETIEKIYDVKKII